MKTIANTDIVKAVGTDRDFTVAIDGAEPRPGYPADMIYLLMVQMPVGNMQDVHHGVRILEKVKEQRNEPEIKLEDADHSWLVRMVEAHAPKVFGLNAERLQEIVKPQEGNRADRRRKDQK
jgi:hypothetical protein